MTEFLCGSIFIRTMGGVQGMLPGEVVKGHRHHFDHTTIFFNGWWRAKKWKAGHALAQTPEIDIERDGPFFLLIDKDCFHEFAFLGGADRGHAYCVFSHRTPDGEVVEKYTGWRDAHELKERADA